MSYNTLRASEETRAREIASSCIGVVQSVRPLSSRNNHLFRVDAPGERAYVLKLYDTSEKLIHNSELLMYEWLRSSTAIRPVVASAATHPQFGTDFLLCAYVEGENVLDLIAGGRWDAASRDRALSQLHDFVVQCRRIPIQGFGEPDPSGAGRSPSWYAFLQDYLARAMARTADHADLRQALEACRSFVASERAYFEDVKPQLVPVDLNLSNFLVTPEGRVVVLDLEAFWGADPLLALGEWGGHAYGTPHWASMRAQWGELSDFQERLIHFYSLLSNVDVALFIMQDDPAALENARPWGNPSRFLDLIRTHQTLLGTTVFRWRPCKLLERNALLRGDWGLKQDARRHERVETFEKTLSRIEKVQRLAGITRVPDITDLDSTDIFAYQSVRPEAEEAENTFTVFSGKGLTREQCRVSAIAEAIERFCAEKRNCPAEAIRAASYRELSAEGDVIHPSDFNMPSSVAFSEDEIIEWVQATDLYTGKCCYVTANTVFYPYTPLTGRTLFRYFTTGLAAGNTYLEAISHGLAEVIERDAAALNRILRNRPAVDIETIDSQESAGIVRKLRNAGLEVIVRYISAPDVSIPVFAATCVDLGAEDPLYLNGGYGAHPSKEVALINALNEAAVSRAGTISGAREDLRKFEAKRQIDYADFKRKYSYWFEVGKNVVDYREVPTFLFGTVLDDLIVMANRVSQAGFHQILMVDLTHGEMLLPVVKVLVPGVERYSFNMQCVGARARRQYRELYKKELPG